MVTLTKKGSIKIKNERKNSFTSLVLQKVTLGETENHWDALRRLTPMPGFLATNIYNF